MPIGIGSPDAAPPDAAAGAEAGALVGVELAGAWPQAASSRVTPNTRAQVRAAVLLTSYLLGHLGAGNDTGFRTDCKPDYTTYAPARAAARTKNGEPGIVPRPVVSVIAYAPVGLLTALH